MRSNATVLILILLAAAVTACSSLNIPVLSQTAGSGTVLFADDFSDPGSGWDTWIMNESAVSYQDGALRIYVNEVQYSYWSRPGKRYEDARIRVDATRMGGPADNDLGILCRYKNEDNYYAFLISSDGYGGIVKVKDGQYNLLTGEALAFIEDIKTGGASNEIGADCIGSSLALFVNGKLAASAEDAEFTAGEVGLIAGTYDMPGVDIAFDNFVIYQP